MRPDQSQSELGGTSEQWNTANSLFGKILPTSPFDPGFCGDNARYHVRNYNRIKILPHTTKKKWSYSLANIFPRRARDGGL
jgi:hypothetical protein